MINPRHGWLVAVLPAEAASFRAVDDALPITLLGAGAKLAPTQPDVELVREPKYLVGDAASAVVVLDAGDVTRSRVPDLRARAVRAALRVTRSVALLPRVRAGRRALASRGYSRLQTLFWEPESALSLSGRTQAGGVRDRFPLGALVVGSRGAESQSLLERVAADASVSVGRLRLASWGVLAIGDSAVLRATVGPAQWLLAAQADSLEDLRGRAPGLERLVPWPRATGRTGIADWLLEPRLPGAPPSAAPDARLVGEALEVLAALHAAGERRAGVGSPAADAEALAAHVPAKLADGLLQLGRELDTRLADLPRSFGHGDFSPANLLVSGGSLTGVVDWNRARQGDLPLLDFLNLLLTIEVARSGRSHGDAFVHYLLPWARAGGDERARAFCRRIGLDLRPALLEDLAAAWWLDRHSRQLKTYSDRLHRRAWMRDNVERPLRALLRS